MARNEVSTLVTEDQNLTGARYKSSGITIPVYDDSFGQLYVHRHSMGISGIVRAKSFEDAYGICEDEFFPDADETLADIIKEYGENYSDNDCFNEAFGYRPNGTGNSNGHKDSMYSKDLNGDSLDVLTQDLLDEWGIELTIEDRE